MLSLNEIQSRRFKKGEKIFLSGSLSDRVYLLKSGLVSLQMESSAGEMELARATAPQIIGEEALCGDATWSTSAVAVNDTEAFELSVFQAQALVETFPPMIKLLVANLLNKQSMLSASVKQSKLVGIAKEICPASDIPKLFAIIYHAAVSTGTVKGEQLTVVWPAYRKYCHWGLLEAPQRLEQALQLLSRLGYTELQMVPSPIPEEPDELGFVHFKDIELLRRFYRYCHDADAQTSCDESDREKFHKILQEIEVWNSQKPSPKTKETSPSS